MATTKHTCGGPAFGRLTDGCPRCEELKAGAQPVRWASSRRREDDLRRSREIHEHFHSERHTNRNHPLWCGPVCTFGEW